MYTTLTNLGHLHWPSTCMRGLIPPSSLTSSRMWPLEVASQMIPTAGWWALLSNLFSLLYHKTCICSGILVRESVSCYLEWRSHKTFPEGFVHVQNDNQWISLHLIINPTNWSCQCFQENFFVCLHMMYVLEYFLTGIASCCPDVSVW